MHDVTTLPTLETVLAQIDQWLNTPGLGVSLWRVLTALRGPDKPDESDWKETTTCVVRTRAFPQVAARYEEWTSSDHVAGQATFASPTQPFVAPRVVTLHPGQPYSHFLNHVCLAAEALQIPIQRVETLNRKPPIQELEV